MLLVPERGGEVRELRFAQRHRAWLSIAGVGAALFVACFSYVLITAYQDVVAANHLRQQLTATRHVQAQNRALRKKVAAYEQQDQKVLTEVSALSHAMGHEASTLGLRASSGGHGLDNLYERLQTIKDEIK